MPNTSEQPMDLPLQGIRVLDLSRVIAGPMCAQVLADLGAEVVKIEHPQRGDDSRDMGLRIGQTQTTHFNSFNRNKQSVTLDLQKPQGLELVRRLLPQFDVVVHNFKPGGAEKLGLGYEALKSLKPDIVYCCVSGYGQDGPEASRPGYDLVIQGESGLMAINGEDNRPPLKFGLALVDMSTGLYAAQAIMAALLGRYRTGQGRMIDLSLYDCGVALTSYYAAETLLLRQEPVRFGNTHPSAIPYGLFETADEPIIIAVGNAPQFEKFCRHVIEQPGLLEDPRYATSAARLQNRQSLLPQVKTLVKAWPREVLLQRLEQAGIPCGKVSGLLEALDSPRTAHHQLVQTITHPQGATSHMVAPPYRFDGERLPLRHAPPTLGQDTRRVLQDGLGLSDEELEHLQALEVLSLP